MRHWAVKTDKIRWMEFHLDKYKTFSKYLQRHHHQSVDNGNLPAILIKKQSFAIAFILINCKLFLELKMCAKYNSSSILLLIHVLISFIQLLIYCLSVECFSPGLLCLAFKFDIRKIYKKVTFWSIALTWM